MRALAASYWPVRRGPIIDAWFVTVIAVAGWINRDQDTASSIYWLSDEPLAQHLQREDALDGPAAPEGVAGEPLGARDRGSIPEDLHGGFGSLGSSSSVA